MILKLQVPDEAPIIDSVSAFHHSPSSKPKHQDFTHINGGILIADIFKLLSLSPQHLKMMRLLFLCLLLLLPAASAVSEEIEGSADSDVDDEDLYQTEKSPLDNGLDPGTPGKTRGAEDDSDKLTLIIIVVAATVLALSVAAIVTIILVRRQMHKRQQGIYSVPTEQDQKGAI